MKKRITFSKVGKVPITLGANIASLKARTQLNRATASVSRSFERLSSGLRINRPNDDPAGLQISTALKSGARVYSQGVRNINDGLSYLSIAESAANSLKTILSRVSELATQASNGVYTDTQREALDTEAQALTEEYNRILDTTTFNGRSILTSSELIQGLTVQAGYGAQESISIRFSASGIAELGTGDGTFEAPIAFSGGNGNYQMTTGDFNGDGKLDIATNSIIDNRVNILLGNGNGTFQANVAVPTDQALSVATGDVNHDGKLDLLATGLNSDSVFVYFGNGNGTFLTAATYSAGDGAASVISVDVNADGKLDLASSSQNDGYLNILIGNGNGTFFAPTQLFSGAFSTEVISADFNNDGKVDLATAAGLEGRINIFIGNGNGSFDARNSYFITFGVPSPLFVSTFDVDNDGKLDLIVPERGAGLVHILIGNGNGTFRGEVSYEDGTSTHTVVGADVNGDGKVDLLTSSYGDDTVNVHFGNGNGTFNAMIAYAGGDSPRDLVAVDIDGDGILDVISTSYSDDNVNVLLGNGTQSESEVLHSLTGISVATAAEAQATQSVLEDYLNEIGSFEASIGAFSSRLSHALDVVTVRAENYTAAAARITDVDVAEEASLLVRNQVLQQAQTAILAQANQQPELVLILLKG